MVIRIIMITELRPVRLAPNTRFMNTRPRVTNTIDSPTESAIRSMILNCLKKMKVQAKPGKKKVSVTPRTILTAGMCSMNGKMTVDSSRNGVKIGLSQPMFCLPLTQSLAGAQYET